ncbi:hypothetical protein OCU04_004877 [Sclerotinia nivalis]|uniref:Uncharacterized protein n=1 Tax=Sclerotinia nivalis TaxID=352851 RepID=A0A9X0ARB6_9HELO|nr:hypothetical protein OCU04_004877 [Sclerotinia nivalis]
MGKPSDERMEQLRAGRKERKERGRGVRISKTRQAAPAAVSGAFGATTTSADQPQRNLSIRTRAPAPRAFFASSPALASTHAAAESQTAAAASRLRAVGPQRPSFNQRIAAAVARHTPGRHRHKRAHQPHQKQRLSQRERFRELTGLPLGNLSLGHNLGGSVAPDIVGNWPAEVLGEELVGSDEEEEEDMEDDDDEDYDEDDDMEDVADYDSEIYDSDGNEWASLGVNMKV